MEKPIHFWSDSKYVPVLAIPPTFMEMDTTSRNAGTSKDLRTAFECVQDTLTSVCDVNSECRHIQVKSVEIGVAFTTLFHYTNQGFAPHFENSRILQAFSHRKMNFDFTGKISLPNNRYLVG